MKNSLKRVLIFGATSAIAEQTARLFVQQGASVFCVARSEQKLESVLDDLKVRAGSEQIIAGCVAELSDQALHEGLIERAVLALGGIDSVLIAHGTLPDQAKCEANVDLVMHEINVNALSVISLLTRLALVFEAQKSGVIAVISSVAGDRGRQSNYVYGAAKGMLSIFLQGLRNRLAKAQVSVVTIKPGFVDTPMTASFDRSGALWAKPEVVARGIVLAMQKGKDDVYLPAFWWGIMLIIKHIPEFIFKRLSL